MSKLPDGWVYSEIKNVARVGNGSTPSRREPRYWDNGIYPWLPTGKVNERIINSADEFITQDALNECPIKIYPPKSVLVAMIGQGKTRGMVAFLTIAAAINQNFACIVPNDNLDNLFLFYCLDNSYEKLRDISHGSNQGALNCGIIEDFVIPVPPLEEQRKIAAILSTWDEAIGLVEQLIGALGRRKQALMQLLLTGAVRFPGFEGEWEEVRLGEFFEEFSETNKLNEDLPILSSSKIHGIVLQSVIFDKRVASKDIRRYKVIKQGDLVYDPMLLWDASIGFLETVERGVISPAYETLRLKQNQWLRNYFRYLFKTHHFRETYKLISQGTNVRRRKAPVEAFLKTTFKMSADQDESMKITSVLETCDALINLQTEHLRNLREQKRGLMQQLLTGQVRV